ncbi:hypothetical protein DVR12_22850 [Chitinophaga silvatica]|uniref:Uncharacterized protein n=1 Tax=Chitinophaga silvatica TaxID=2282649 RepID=A0A3E1Y4A8_9BACT|nr:hypothetical protein [Chitinophaga silvatica]RFS19476.1 hypothetical protein DVR12_22850 [Chitinophaga silvatica]
MKNSGAAKWWLAGCLCVAFTQNVKAQDPEKVKATIIYQMMDLDYRIAFIPGNKDTDCRTIYANQAKEEFLEFKKLLEPNLSLFKPGQQTRLTNYQKALEEILLTDVVFNTLKKPNYSTSKSIDEPEAAVKFSAHLHNMARNLLIDNLENIYNLDLVLAISNLSIASEAVALRSTSDDCRAYASSQLEAGKKNLDKLYQAAKSSNKPEVNSEIEKLLVLFKNNATGIPAQTAELYNNGLIKLSPGGKLAAKEASRSAKEDLQKREVRLKMLYPTTKVYLNAKVKQLKEGEKYQVQLPSIADTWAAQHAIYISSDAKAAKKGETPDYTFKIITPGVKDFKIEAPQFAQGTVKANVMFHPTIEVRGYFANIYYHFPLKVEVWNKAGQLEKTIVVIGENDWLGDMFHADYLRDQKPEEQNSVATIRGFDNIEMAKKGIETERENIIRRLQQNSWIVLADYISKALTTAYGSDKVSNYMYPIYGLKDATPEQAELVSLIDRTKEAISNIGDKDKTAASINTLKGIVTEYEQRLTGDVTPNMKALCLMNAAQAALLSDQINKSVELYQAYLSVEKDNMGMQMSYEKVIPSYYYRGVMADGSVDPIVLREPPAKFRKW